MKTLAALLVSLALSTAAFAGSKGAEPAHVSQGQTIDLAAQAVPGKTTVFDFTSKYCGPCQTYNEPLAKLHAKRADVAVVKVDINRPDVKGIDWKSPVARQYQLQSIPHFKIYGPDGKLVAEDKLVVGADGNLVSRESPAREMVDGMIAALK
jgi:thiol-disulfide isomerase/thioredoxin